MKTIVKDKPVLSKGQGETIRSGRQLMQWRRSIGINRPTLAALSGCSTRSMATKEAKGRLSLSKERGLNEAYRLLLGLCEIMEPANVSSWLRQPNEWLAGHAPMEAITQGKSDEVWQLIHHTKSDGYL